MSHFSFNKLADRLWVGSYPTNPEDFDTLKSLGVAAVLSLQTDGDIHASGLLPKTVWRMAMASGLDYERFPIRDFVEEAVRRAIVQAMGHLHALFELIDDDEAVYVHCTAGINRSPSVALGYAILRDGRSAEEVLDAARRARGEIRPYEAVLRALEKDRDANWAQVLEEAEREED
jgi:protein-tyrosine phosphatase